MTDTQKQELVDILVQCSLEDTSFLNNRLYELVDLDGERLMEEYMS